MPIKILMPALSPTMTEGKLVKWHKAEGDTIASGDVLCEIETDKATMEVEAVDEGTLGRIIVADGTDVPVNTVIGLILEEDEDAASLDSVSLDTPAAPALVTASETSAPAPVVAAAPAPKGKRIFASPLARRMAKDAGLDLSTIKGSGPHGRIVKKDVEGVSPSAVAKAVVPSANAVVSTEPAQVPHSTMRKVIAQRLTQSKQTVPHFYLTVDCRIDKLLESRKEINENAPEGVKISVNDFIIKAVAGAMEKVPAANVSWTEEAMLQYNAIDICVAVATPGGLMTPVVRNADLKGLGEISANVKDLAGRAKDGKLMPEEYQGGGFTISNLGMFGIKEFSAIINPPQACILAVGAGVQQPVVIDGELAVATVMSCTLSVDHRAVDGAVGAQFMSAFKSLIENPSLMLL